MIRGLALETEEKLLNRIVINPKVMTGKPIIKGTKILGERKHRCGSSRNCKPT